MTSISTSTRRWAVSARTRGEVLTAGVSAPPLELFLLGVPAGFTPQEIEGWLNDLASVASETSRNDIRIRAIPPLLHHALTGLLFSHAELWSASGGAPCSAAFVDAAEGPAFGWLGQGRVRLLVEGRPYEPQWVRVRDDQGREARAAVLPPGARIELSLEYRPEGAGEGEPPARLDAEWDAAPESEPAAAMPPAPEPAAVAEPASGEAAPEPATFVTGVEIESAYTQALAPLPEALPTEQPGLAPAPADFAPPSIESAGETLLAGSPPADERPPHPVGRWLSRIAGLGRRPPASRAPVADPASEATPLSSYDALLSEPADETPCEEQPVAEAAAEPADQLRSRGAGVVAEILTMDTPIGGELEADAPSEPPPAGATAATAGLAPSGFEDIFAQDSPAPEDPAPHGAPDDQPEPGIEPGSPYPVLRVPAARSEGPIEVVHEPVGAHERFAIPSLPGTAGSAARALEHESGGAPEFEGMPTLPLPAGEPQADEPSGAGPPAVRAVRRAAWPAPEELVERRPSRSLAWIGAALVATLFGAGWMLGHWQDDRNDTAASPASRLLRAVGLGSARFTADVESEPPEAWIAVDGRDIARRTPASLELKPGRHRITVSLPDLGGVDTDVSGERDQRMPVSVSLDGALHVEAADPSTPVQVTVDGQPRGWLPVDLDPIAPGLHELQFSGPNMPAWVQNVTLRVREHGDLVAQAMSSPPTGVLQVQATINDEQGSAPLAGAQVYVDGAPRGVTPYSVELPRGPHSLRVTYRGETAPIQVIDLPGGNQRYATFAFGLASDQPRLVLASAYPRMPSASPTIVSAVVEGLQAADVREAWLHVRSPEGLWRSYAMTVGRGVRGAALTVPFPPAAFDAQGAARWYLSASTAQGDEYFSEIQNTALER